MDDVSVKVASGDCRATDGLTGRVGDSATKGVTTGNGDATIEATLRVDDVSVEVALRVGDVASIELVTGVGGDGT